MRLFATLSGLALCGLAAFVPNYPIEAVALWAPGLALVLWGSQRPARRSMSPADAEAHLDDWLRHDLTVQPVSVRRPYDWMEEGL